LIGGWDVGVILGSSCFTNSLDVLGIERGDVMSVRAYRVKQIDFEDSESFNLWHDRKLMDFLDREYDFSGSLNGGSGMVELPIKALKEAIKLDLGEDTVKALQRDIEACQDEYITYYCF